MKHNGIMKQTNILYLLLISLVSAMGGLLFGYDWVVIGGAKIFYEPFFGLEASAALRGWAMSSALIGCLVGALMAGAWSDRYGRKKLLIIAAVLFSLSAYGTGAVDSFNWFIFYRILGGFGIGIASNISPIYIAEVSPARMRGQFVSLNQLTIVVGILAAQLANWQIGDQYSNHGTRGTIYATNVTVSFTSPSVGHVTLTRVIKAKYPSRGGDSGGIIYSGSNNIYGIHEGSSKDGFTYFISASEINRTMNLTTY